MDLKKDSTIGIVGGMGPQAGIDLANHICRLVEADKDQDHKSVILMSFPGYIVDRTAFIEGKEEVNPAYNIIRVIDKLENAGAEVVGMACNSSHMPEIYDVILEELERLNSQVKLLHMPFETCRYIEGQYPQVRRVGVMSTNGTYKSGIYTKILQNMGFNAIIPEFEFQNDVIHRMIYDSEYGIKSRADCIRGEVTVLLKKALDFFKDQKADGIILGCTELSLVLKEHSINDMLIFNSNEILAKALIGATEGNNEVTEVKSNLKLSGDHVL